LNIEWLKGWLSANTDVDASLAAAAFTKTGGPATVEAFALWLLETDAIDAAQYASVLSSQTVNTAVPELGTWVAPLTEEDWDPSTIVPTGELSLPVLEPAAAPSNEAAETAAELAYKKLGVVGRGGMARSNARCETRC